MPKNPQNFVCRFDLYFSEKITFFVEKLIEKLKSDDCRTL